MPWRVCDGADIELRSRTCMGAAGEGWSGEMDFGRGAAYPSRCHERCDSTTISTPLFFSSSSCSAGEGSGQRAAGSEQRAGRAPCRDGGAGGRPPGRSTSPNFLGLGRGFRRGARPLTTDARRSTPLPLHLQWPLLPEDRQAPSPPPARAFQTERKLLGPLVASLYTRSRSPTHNNQPLCAQSARQAAEG